MYVVQRLHLLPNGKGKKAYQALYDYRGNEGTSWPAGCSGHQFAWAVPTAPKDDTSKLSGFRTGVKIDGVVDEWKGTESVVDAETILGLFRHLGT